MKFGKRLAAEAAASQFGPSAFLEYKLLKRALSADCAAADSTGPAFDRALRSELQKVCAFYAEKEEELAASLVALSPAHADASSSAAAARSAAPAQQAAKEAALRREAAALRKYVALNYIAVVKAVKKRNRHLRSACAAAAADAGRGPAAAAAVPRLRALDVLARQSFFTSTRLATLTTRLTLREAQQKSQQQGSKGQQQQLPGLSPVPSPTSTQQLAEFTCPICLSLLRAPVVLTCAHRFCWACLLTQCTAAAAAHQAAQRLALARLPWGDECGKEAGDDEDLSTHAHAAVWEGEGSEDEAATIATFDCAVCRKAQILDLDRLQVDPHLDAFMQQLHRQKEEAAAAQQQETGGSMIVSLAQAQQQSPSLTIQLSRPETAQEEDAAMSVSLGSAVTAPSTCRSSAASGSLVAVVEDEEQEERESPEAAEAQHRAAATMAVVAAAAAEQLPSEPERAVPVEEADEHYRTPSGEPPLLPPQAPEHKGRLVVCLDMDGTLISAFAPKRAPRLPPGAVSYVVGRGGVLNPGGVFVVERPGLGEFFARISQFAEVVLFTAGLEDYAAPICDELQARYGALLHRLYRPATVAFDVYPCVKDMSRLGRDLGRCVLVDDTPLAFWQQPDNGVPVLQFRGDMDDRLLTEAVAPMLEALAKEGDVRGALARRFGMRRWFAAQGLPAAPETAAAAAPGASVIPRPVPAMHRAPSAPSFVAAPQRSKAVRPSAASVAAGAAAAARAGAALPAASVLHSSPARVAAATNGCAPMRTVLCMDFDKTITDWDAGERLCNQLAPELTSLLAHMEMPANFVPATNAVLAEMHRRGISRDRLLATLRDMGRELPLASGTLLRWAASTPGLETIVLSDCNSVFISHILTGAKVLPCISQVVTNTASFQRADLPALPGASAAAQLPPPRPRPSSPGRSWSLFGFRKGSSSSSCTVSDASTALAAPGHRLTITPRHDHKSCGHHGCTLCPANLCKGLELDVLLAARIPGTRVIYAGDGANDLCPALRLGPDDVVLAREGHGLARLIAMRANGNCPDDGRGSVAATVRLWSTHDELLRLVQQFMAA